MSVPNRAVDVEAFTKGDASLGVVEVSVAFVELPDFGVVDAAEPLAAAALFEGGVLDTALLDVWAVGVDVPVCAGVEVEETNGGACWMYEPSGWMA